MLRKVGLIKKHYSSVILPVAIFAILALWLPVVLIGQSIVIGGERYWWLSDDAMISMRFAHNLADGHGLVWNPGERVEGYTNFLWTVYIAFVHLLPIPLSKTSLVILLTNIALSIAALPFLVRFVRLLGGRTLVVAATLAGYVLSKITMYWAASGLETSLLTFLFILAAYRVVKESKSNQPRPLTYLLIATMSLVRADSIVLSALLYMLAFLLHREKKLVGIYCAVSILLPAAHEIFRILYYGELLPNTAYLKTAHWDNRSVAGIKYVIDFAKHYAPMLVFAILGLILSRQAIQYYLFGLFVLYAVYVAYIGGDVFENFRFFVPVLPWLLALAFLGIQNLRLPRGPSLALSVVCLLLTPLLFSGYKSLLVPSYKDAGNIRIALLLKKNTPAEVKVAGFWAGSIFYFSERYGIDFLGKSDRHIAHLPVASDGLKPGHNKFDFDYSLTELKPDIVISNFTLPVDEARMRRASTGNWAFTGQLYFHPVFRESCLPNPINIETWHTVFVCDWSSQMENRDKWEDVKIER